MWVRGGWGWETGVWGVRGGWGWETGGWGRWVGWGLRFLHKIMTFYSSRVSPYTRTRDSHDNAQPFFSNKNPRVLSLPLSSRSGWSATSCQRCQAQGLLPDPETAWAEAADMTELFLSPARWDLSHPCCFGNSSVEQKDGRRSLPKRAWS